MSSINSANSLAVAPPGPPPNSVVDASYSESFFIRVPCNVQNCSQDGVHSEPLEGAELLSPETVSNAVQSVIVPISNSENPNPENLPPMNRVYGPRYPNLPLENQLDDCSCLIENRRPTLILTCCVAWSILLVGSGTLGYYFLRT